MWLRNYYNMLTAILLCDDTLSSTTQPTDYDPPIMIRRASGSWADANGADLGSSPSGQYVTKYFIPPFDKAGGWSGGVGLVTSSVPSSLLGSNGAVGLAFGAGTTPATYDDYVLENPITSGLTLVSASGTLTQPTSYDSVTHHISSTRSFTVNNSSASPITISEFGIYAPYTDNASCCLIYRDVLATPITLNPSESCIISLTRDAEVYNYTPY